MKFKGENLLATEGTEKNRGFCFVLGLSTDINTVQIVQYPKNPLCSL
jgi:hypothetical protein